MALPTTRSGRASVPATARRWDPYSEMEGLYDRMSQLMQGVLGGYAPVPAGAADIEETDDAYVVEIDLPGVKPEDLDVEVQDNTLRIAGEIKEKERVGILRRQTRHVGRFEYVVALPGEVDPDQVDGSLADGVLTVRIGKAAKSRPHRVEIKGS